MLLGQSECALWHDVAIVLNCEHGVQETVLLSQVSWHKALVWVLWWSVLKWVYLFLLLLKLLLLGNLWLWDLDVDKIAFAGKWTAQFVVLVLMLSVDLSELSEHHV